MGEYAERISTLEIVLQLKRSAGRDDIAETDIAKLVAMVFDVADAIGPLLKRIPQTFQQYTEHDIGHCCNIIYLMGKFIPKETLERLNGLELAFLVLAALLHDTGMVVTDDEKAQALQSNNFASFLAGHSERAGAILKARTDGDPVLADLIQDALLAEYFRRIHPERVWAFAKKHLEVNLVFRETDISNSLLKVCESHAWGVHESHDPRRAEKAVYKLDTNRPVHNVPLNLQYLACCLRLADIMDFDRSRTPHAVFQSIRFTEEKSWEEWNKHLQVSGWSINEYEVQYVAECTHPAYYVAVHDFLDWIDAELRECRQLLVKEAPKGIAERYLLHLPPVVERWKVEMADKRYLAGAFRFQLDYERIMQLLMDKSLYPDPSLCLRELLQNALDACRNKEAIAKSKGMAAIYTPRITIWDFSEEPENRRIVFQDNGIGMSRKIVENYFLRVGRSYYRSAEFDVERQRLKEAGIELEACSQFGIGILSCFMLADRFTVETYRLGNDPLEITIDGPTKYFTIRVLDLPPPAEFPSLATSDQEDGPPNYSGTRITIHLRSDATVDVYQVLENFAVNVEYELHIYRAEEMRTIPCRRWEPEEIRISDFPIVSEASLNRYTNWALTDDFEEAPEWWSNLDEALTPSRIPFEEYPFARHIRGSAWFWLLKGAEGGVCPKRGYLQLHKALVCTDLPALIGEITSMKRTLFLNAWRTFLTKLERYLTEDIMAAIPKHVHEALVDIAIPNFAMYSDASKGEANKYANNIIRRWEKLSRIERQTAVTSLKAFDDTAILWYQSPGVPGELLQATLEWASQPLKFRGNNSREPSRDYVDIGTSPHALALHGIRLPAGFVQWSPMAGEAAKLRLFCFPGGLQLDTRGLAAPVPAASRLFVERHEAEKVAVPFARAALRHACHLVSCGSEEEGWDDWLDSLVSSTRNLYFWQEVIRQEWDILEPLIRYTVSEAGAEEYIKLSREQLVERFGRWVPVFYLWDANIFDFGLPRDHQNYLADYSLRHRPNRQRKDGTEEVDMETRVMGPENTL